ncbi:MAG TPA: L-glutamate gamma-semialdehyde dehydrogenase [Planctomycetota bacterium]|jgi:1-pyrroline-5-carboxylate dehydrogenase|nr:L-glutamate gamma-semialdehyde dehydrogenase [Planctomycetota bacterium]
MTLDFRNEPILDFSRNPEAKAALQKAIDDFVPVDCPLVIAGARLTTKASIVSHNPCQPDRIVGRAAKASAAQAEKAIRSAHDSFASWSRTAPGVRADVLLRAADLLRRRRHELNATLVLEVGKTWTEADADTAEAIDFCAFYAQEILRYAQEQPLTPVKGERNRLTYQPLGVGIVISPWNFPCAILAGMTAAAIVTGNTVVLKPSSLAPVIGYKVVEILEEAGLPKGVLNYLPCSGKDVGDLLVDHPLTRFVSFTGSRDVGVRIHERAAKLQPGQKWLKRTVIEMGGKDAIIVDEDADLEAAASGIVASAFGYQGQKCSACSRAILVEKVYDRVLDLVTAKTKALKVGDVRDPDTQMGAVIDENQLKKVLGYIATGKREGRLVAGGGPRQGDGYFVEPTVFADVLPQARIAREEIFGPVLAILKARDYDDAIRIANDSEYGLTGAFYGKARIDRAKEEFYAGNLYINRKCTGALVGVHPFGGFDMSGTNAKAGGRDYLRLFLEAKVVSEKI